MKKITEIPKNDKPREKLAAKGVEALSSKELLMVILGKGIKGRDVTVLATDILKLIEKENQPRYETIKWYLDIIGLDYQSTIKVINKIPKRYGK